MLFTGYIDESNTHGPAPNVIMSAFLGTGRQWELFGRGLKGLQRRDGFNILHATDFKGKKGEFRGWSDARCKRLISDLVDLFRTELAEGIVTSLRHELYQVEYLAKLPSKMPKKSQYGLCFQATLDRLLEATMRHRGMVALSVVLEDGHRNAGGAGVIFTERRDRFHRKHGAHALNTFKLAGKKTSPQLMAADFLAHTFGMISQEYPGGVQAYGNMTDELPKRRESGLTIQEVTPEYLQACRDEFEADGRATQEAYLKRKAARLAPS